MDIRPALLQDALAISLVLEELVAAKKRTKASDAEFAANHYVNHPDQIRCTIAVDQDGIVLGFQSLKFARENNPYGTPVGWGIIGTHVRPSAARKGVGQKLFHSTKEAASQFGVCKIEAFISQRNDVAIAYYEAMGFRTYRTLKDVVCKCYKLS